MPQNPHATVPLPLRVQLSRSGDGLEVRAWGDVVGERRDLVAVPPAVEIPGDGGDLRPAGRALYAALFGGEAGRALEEARTAVAPGNPSAASISPGGNAPGRSDLLHSRTKGNVARSLPCPLRRLSSSVMEAMFSAMRNGAASATKTTPSTPCRTAARAPAERACPGTV